MAAAQRHVTLLLLLLLAAAPLHAQTCRAARSAPVLDHVVIVVRDLDRAGSGFQQHGFRLKQGRLHANNLLNRHIKFRDGSSIELMTVQGAPGDAMARRYTDLMAAGDGGVYVALRVDGIDVPAQLADSLRLLPHRSASGPWRFLGFDAASPAAAVFFSAGYLPVQDPDSLLSHRRAVTGLAEVWLEGGTGLRDLLVQLGARGCGNTEFAGRSGERFALSNGSVVIVPPRRDARPRVLGAVLWSDGNHEMIRPHPQFWISYRRRSVTTSHE